MVFVFFLDGDGDHRDLHVLTHSFPTRRSSDLPVVAAPQEPDLVVLWNIVIEEQQFPFKLLQDRGAKRLRIWRPAEAGIVRISPDLEVLGKSVIGIAIAIRPYHPGFFGADEIGIAPWRDSERQNL